MAQGSIDQVLAIRNPIAVSPTKTRTMGGSTRLRLPILRSRRVHEAEVET